MHPACSVVLMLVATGTAAFSQTMIGYGSVAGSTGSAGAAAGAKLNKSIGNALGAAARVTQSAADVSTAPAPMIPAAVIQPKHAAPSTPASPPPATVIGLASEAFAGIHAGSKKEEVDKLPAPAYKMAIPDDGHLNEVYRYQTDGKDIATVRLTDGVVTAVQFPAH